MATFFKYAQGRTVNSKLIVGASIYQKDGKYKVAIDLDTVNPDRRTVYSDPYATESEAQQFINTIPAE